MLPRLAWRRPSRSTPSQTAKIEDTYLEHDHFLQLSREASKILSCLSYSKRKIPGPYQDNIIVYACAIWFGLRFGLRLNCQ